MLLGRGVWVASDGGLDIPSHPETCSRGLSGRQEPPSPLFLRFPPPGAEGGPWRRPPAPPVRASVSALQLDAQAASDLELHGLNVQRRLKWKKVRGSQGDRAVT